MVVVKDRGVKVESSSLATPQRSEPELVLGSWYERRGKRMLDVVGALVLLVTFLPIFGVVALIVRFALGPGSVVFRQERVGQDGRTFTILKFRSMLADRRISNEEYAGPNRRLNHKTSHDPRHRPVGRFLRSTSIDELPQLVNVLRGEMSLVGPRPELLSIVTAKQLTDHPRHLARPGITGPFQVSSLRRFGQLELGFDMDVEYVSTIRFRGDCAYLLKTIATPFSRRGT